MKKILSILLFLSIVFFATGCAPQTGEAKITFPKEFNKVSENSYQLSADWYGKTINFRDYVQVNGETTWVLSKNPSGKNPITTFSVTLGRHKTTYYVVCSDRIGISNCYKITIDVEDRVKNFFFTEFDYEAVYDYCKSTWGDFTKDLYYGHFGAYHNATIWEQIESHNVKGNTTFFCEISGTEFSNDQAFPTNEPTKTGYIFDGWERVCTSNRLNGEPAGESRYVLDVKENGQYDYCAYVAKWKKIS